MVVFDHSPRRWIRPSADSADPAPASKAMRVRLFAPPRKPDFDVQKQFLCLVSPGTMLPNKSSWVRKDRFYHSQEIQGHAKNSDIWEFLCTTLYMWRHSQISSMYTGRPIRLVKTSRWLGFGEFRQLVGHYCSYLLPRQNGGTFQISVNRRFLLTLWVTLHTS